MNAIYEASEWQDYALCAQTDPELYFANRGEGDLTRDAKRLCNGNPKRGIAPCPVRAECLADAIANDERFGVRGGLTAHERNRPRKDQA